MLLELLYNVNLGVVTAAGGGALSEVGVAAVVTAAAAGVDTGFAAVLVSVAGVDTGAGVGTDEDATFGLVIITTMNLFSSMEYSVF